MEIVYEYIATDEENRTTPLSPCLVNHTLYPSLFVADISKVAEWELDGEIWS
tara:strand:+ start:344 stop:499 length:156 start_codon:yes stop_codon:yes gene_type:complete